MVLEQLTASGREIKNPRVLEVIGAVPRHEFVPASGQRFAYSDEPYPSATARQSLNLSLLPL